MKKLVFTICLISNFIGINVYADFFKDSFSIKLVQIKKRRSGSIKKEKMSIDYKYSGKVRLSNEKKSVFVANNNKSWYYVPPITTANGAKGDLIINPKNSFSFVKIFDALKNGVSSNKAYTVEKINSLSYRLKFQKEYLDKYNFKEAQLDFNEKKDKSFKISDVKKMYLTYKDNSKTEYEFELIRSEVSFAEDHFVFKIPENVKVIKN